MPKLTITSLCKEARKFSEAESSFAEPSLFGVTDGKAVGTYLEQKFRTYLSTLGYVFEAGNSANGIDFPGLDVDMKVTSIRQPQSSCPFRSARQKIYGLGYSLLVFVYDKVDNSKKRTATLKISDTIFVEAARTADFQTTKGILSILDNDGNADDIRAFLEERHLPVEGITMGNLVDELMKQRPMQGYLTISNALQWRLQYARVIEKAGAVNGIDVVHRNHPE
jgi:hypothetical protein